MGQHIADVLGILNIPRLVVESDPARVGELEKQGVPTLFGDAANSEILNHTGMEHARALVITLPEEAAAEIVVAAARELAPKLPIIVRASTRSGVTRLAALGAQDVIHPELEGGLEVVRHTMLRLGLPATQVERYADAVRQDHYEEIVSTPEEHSVLDQLMQAARSMEIAWLTLDTSSPLVGQSVAEANLRERTGASVIAVSRNRLLIANPKSAFEFQEGDLVALIGDASQVSAAERLLTPNQSKSPGFDPVVAIEETAVSGS